MVSDKHVIRIVCRHVHQQHPLHGLAHGATSNICMSFGSHLTRCVCFCLQLAGTCMGNIHFKDLRMAAMLGVFFRLT
jgi:hypothetical protein